MGSSEKTMRDGAGFTPADLGKLKEDVDATIPDLTGIDFDAAIKRNTGRCLSIG